MNRVDIISNLLNMSDEEFEDKRFLLEMSKEEFENKRFVLEMSNKEFNYKKDCLFNSYSWFNKLYDREEYIDMSDREFDKRRIFLDIDENRFNIMLPFYEQLHRMEDSWFLDPKSKELVEQLCCDSSVGQDVLSLYMFKHQTELGSDIEALEVFLTAFLTKYQLDSKMIIVDIGTSYKITLPNIMISSSDEIVDFVDTFKDFLKIKMEIDELSRNITANINERSANKGNIYIVNCKNFYNTDKSKTIINSSEDELFVDHIKQNRPRWYKPDKWISIDNFHEAYKDFGLPKSRKHFSTNFRNILWSEKRKNPVTKRFEYRCVDLW